MIKINIFEWMNTTKKQQQFSLYEEEKEKLNRGDKYKLVEREVEII